MVVSLWKVCLTNFNSKITSNLIISIRHGHHMRGKPPGIARTLQQRLDEINKTDPEVDFKVDIGLPAPQRHRSDYLKERIQLTKSNKNDTNLEKLARKRELLINLKDVQDVWLQLNGPYHIKTIADHYGIYQHLFGDAYFMPRVPLNVYFESSNENIPVHYGNIVKPSEAQAKPKVLYDCKDDDLWTLILTNPDGHFVKQDAEYVHWFIGNIPGNQIDKGDVIFDYLQPFPPRGTGFHRFIFILYKQDKKIDFSSLKKSGSLNLEQRTFSTLEFYRERQDYITPAGLAFFQSNWDETLTIFYHKTLNMKEPIFEYDFAPPYIRPQEWFPLRKPFNLYMDKYRDPKQINKEFLLRKLKNVHPFQTPKPPLKYPNAQYFEGYVPSWLKLEKTKSRMKWGRINDIE